MIKKNKYSSIIHENLSKNKKISLKVLLEEEETEPDSDSDSDSGSDSGSDDDSSSGGGSDPFGALDDKSDSSDSSDTALDDSGEDSGESDDGATGNSASDGAQLDLAGLKQTLSNIDKTNRMITKKDKILKKSLDLNSKKLKLNTFLNEETEDAEKIVKDIEDKINQNDDLKNKISAIKVKQTQGEYFDIDNEVSLAMYKLINFNQQYDIVDLVKELFLTKIKLLSSNKEMQEKCDEFEEKFAIALNKNKHKIKDLPGAKYYNDDSVYLEKPAKYNGAVGAKSQG